MFAVFQLALASSVVFGTAALFDHQWPHSFVGDLKTLQAQAVALAMMSLAWIAVRLALRRFGVSAGVAESKEDEGEAPSRLFDPAAAAKLLYPGWPGVDRVITALLLVFIVSLSLYGVHAGMIDGASSRLGAFDREPEFCRDRAWRGLVVTAAGVVAGLLRRIVGAL